MGEPKSPELDALDRKMLYELDLNSRISIPSLARKVRTSAARARYRFKCLVKSGAIHSFITIVDYRALGLRIYNLNYKVREMSPAAMDRLLVYLARQPSIIDVLATEGNYDISISLLASDIDEAAEYLWMIRERLGPHIIQEALVLQTDSFFYSRDAILSSSADSPAKLLYHLRPNPNIVRLDEEDRRILSTMASHADWPVWRIAKSAKMSGPAAYARIKKLEKQKVILGYSIMLDPALGGFSQYRVSVKLHYIPAARRHELARFLQQLPNVWRSSFLFGDFDLSYDVIAPNSALLRETMGRVYGRFGPHIIRQEWVRVHSTLKFSFYPSSDKPLLRDEHGF